MAYIVMAVHLAETSRAHEIAADDRADVRASLRAHARTFREVVSDSSR